MKRKWTLLTIYIITLILIFPINSSYLSAVNDTLQPDQIEIKVAAVEENKDAATESDKQTEAESVGESEEAQEQDMPALTAAMKGTKMVENERFEMFVDEKNMNVKIVEKKTKTEWYGAPQVDKKTPPNNLKFIQSPVHISYTEGTETSQTYTLQDKENTMDLQKIDGGVKVNFSIEKYKISFAVEYLLTETGFEVNVPYESIQEQGTARLVSLELFPFFNAATNWAEGAVFVPDGSGALMKIKQQRSINFNTYSEFVYGSDPIFLKKSHQFVGPVWRQNHNPKQKAALPVYGIYADNKASLAIITKGDYDAKINAVPAGIRNISLYRAAAEFIYRNDDVIFLGNSGEIPLYQGLMIQGDRSVRFVLLENEEANYVGLARAYREYLTKEQNLQQVQLDGVPMQIRLFGGILRDEVIGKTFISMTTFEQAKTIIEKLLEQGIHNIELTIDGWSAKGIYGEQPRHFPVESNLGGFKGMQDLAVFAKQNGISLYLKVNYVRPFDDTGDFRKSSDAVYGIKRDPQKIYNYYVSNNYSRFSQLFYLLKPERVFQNHIQREIADYKELGIDGVHLKYMADLLYSDQDPKMLTSRNDTKDVWLKALELFNREIGKTAVDYGFAYALGHVSRIDDIPVNSSQFTFLDETVPFYQIVLHGLVPYTVKPSNLRDDPRIEFLRALEYGALPSYELTYAPTKNLQRTMESRLFSSHYDYWLESSIQEYKKMEKVYELVWDQSIVNHEKLKRSVFRTTYENGIQVLVNYDNKNTNIDSHEIEAYGYLVLKGGQ